MSIEWKYDSSYNSSLNDGIIDIIYCSNVEMTIPIQYFWTVLLKDGKEYDLTNPILSKILKSSNDLNALKIARQNYLYLHSINLD
jgi:hypothetical protein